MNLRLLIFVCILMVAASCNGTEPTPEATTTLHGAIVPTRASPTPSPTVTPSPTPTTNFTATAEINATFTQEALNSQATANIQSTLEILATTTAAADATRSAVATLDTLATLTSEAISTQTVQATIDIQSTADTLATQNTILPTVTSRPTSVSSNTASGERITFGRTVQGFVGEDDYSVKYTFEANEGDVITIEMEGLSGDLDPYLSLLGSDGTELVFNDDRPDAADSRDALIDSYAIATTGTYTIVATRFSQDVGTTQGEFRLSLNREDSGLVLQAGQIRYGETVTGAIQPGSTTLEVVFGAAEGDVIFIEMIRTNGNLDPLVILIDPDGNEIAEADDHPSRDTQDALLSAFIIPSTGTYRIIATRFNRELGETQGTFELTLTELGALSPGTTLSYGDSVEGTITDTVTSIEFQFEGVQDDVINIQMETISGNLDTLIALIDPTGAEIINNDDAQEAGSTDSLIRNFTLSSSGTYTILATRFNRELGTSVGTFKITLERITVRENAAVSPRSTLSIGETVNGLLTIKDPLQTYTFDGNAGQTITISMTRLTNNLDPYLILLNPQGRQIARNDDRSDDDSDSLLDNIILPDNGKYTLVTTRYNKNFGETSGAFELQITETQGRTDSADFTIETAIGSIENGAITDEISELYYTFKAQAGEIVTIKLRAIDDEFDPLLILENRHGNQLFSNDDNVLDDSVSNSALFDVILPESGFYTIVASTYMDDEDNYTPGEFELTLTTAGNANDSRAIPVQAALNNFYSYGDRADDLIIVHYAAGDWTDDDDMDHEVAVLLTYQLPELKGPIERATLDLSRCYTTTDSVFDQFGTLYIRLNRMYNSTLDLDSAVNQNARLVGEINECTSIDVTEATRRAYVEGNTFIQFRAAFEDSDILLNNDIDSVIFVSPYLKLLPSR